jgi:LysM repeat protein
MAAALVPLVAAAVTLQASYTVRPGDTLSDLARRHGTTVPELARVNAIPNPDRIHVGQWLALPATQAAVGRAEVGSLLDQGARRYGWTPSFVKALAWQESGWQTDVVSDAGAVGVMQVLPSTGRFVSRELVGRDLDLHDPADNIEAGVAFLDYLYRLTDRDTRLTLAGYYQGLASVRRNGAYPETERFIENVLVLRAHF